MSVDKQKSYFTFIWVHKTTHTRLDFDKILYLNFEWENANRIDFFFKYIDWMCSSLFLLLFRYFRLLHGIYLNFTLHVFRVLLHDVGLLYRPLNKRIRPMIYIHPNYSRLWLMLYQLIALVFLLLNGVWLHPLDHSL